MMLDGPRDQFFLPVEACAYFKLFPGAAMKVPTVGWIHVSLKVHDG